jgi:uncharacterized lipoprotein NlpE involved in copper resistance
VRAVTVVLLTVVATIALSGCNDRQDAYRNGTPIVAGAADDSGLVTAQHSECDHGAEILNYLATGDNGGDPDLDQLFANYVGVSEPKARALADQWIEGCDQQYAQQEAAASSSAAQARAEASYETAQSASAAAASASEAQQEATVLANQQRSCAAIGGRVFDGVCHSTSPGDSTATGNPPCSSAVVAFNFEGTIDLPNLTDAESFRPGCWR